MMSPTTTGPDAITESVREFYELYPYPAEGQPTLRTGFDPRLALSLGQRPRPASGRLSILDAGCGRGVGLVGCASLNPHAELLGIDLCRSALADAGAQVEARGLRNVRLAEVDLMTLEGLEVPEGGFDLIYSSGVVHHLSDPVEGLHRLGEVLAPHGMIAFMVYGAIGRAGITRVARALEAWLDADSPLPERLAQARELVGALADEKNPDCPWHDAALAPDAEFVDRYLHPNEVTYAVPGLFDLIEASGLRFVRWADSRAWSVEEWIPEGPLRASVEALPERERYTLIEQLAEPRTLELYLCRRENGPRILPAREAWKQTLFAANPEVCYDVGTRNLWGESRVESIGCRYRDADRLDLGQGPIAQAAWILSTQNQPFRGETLIGALTERGLGTAQALDTLAELLRMELLYAPHEVELGQVRPGQNRK